MNNNQPINKEPNLSAVQPKSNNNLLIVLGVLIAIIIGMILYVSSSSTSPSSLVDETAFHEEEEVITENEAVSTDNADKIKAVEETRPKVVNTPKNKETTKAVNRSKEYVHTVKPGENLFNIAQKYNIPQQDLKELNNLSNNNLRVDQQIKIKITAEHEVQSGEGILAIAKKYNVDKNLILKANNLNNESLKLNQRLIIPLP